MHFNNAGCGLLAAPVLATMVDHLRLEASIGGYEAAAARAEQVRAFYTETAAAIGRVLLLHSSSAMSRAMWSASR